MNNIASAIEPVIQHLTQELTGIRTGRANPALIEGVKITAYNTVMPLVQLASITVSDARTIVIQPWDKNVLKDIERGLLQSDLGFTPVNDGTIIRLTVPTLTEERRKEYIKILHGKLEHARVQIRKIREDEFRSLKEAKQEGTLSENDQFSQQKSIQKQIDETIAMIEELGTKKEEEVLTL